MPIDIGGIISGFDAGRRKFRDEEVARATRDQDREFSILQALATHPDAEMAAIGAAGLLELASGGTPKAGKGLRGFLGEVDRSSHLPAIQAFLRGPAGAEAQAMPGAAAQPDSAVVDPQRQAQGPTIPPVPEQAAPGTGPGVTSSTFGAPEGPAIGGTQPPIFGGGMTEEAGGPPAMAGAMPAPPAPPETPPQRMRRLYPSAADVAAETTFRNLQARLQAIVQTIQQAGGTQQDVLNATLGVAGAPRRMTATKPMNAQYRTADGQELEGTVIFDPASGQAEVDGQPVTILRMQPTNPPRPIRQRMNTDGTFTDVYLDPSNLNAGPLATVNTGIPVPPPPAPITGTFAMGDDVYALPRGGGDPQRLGPRPTPSTANALSPEQAEATGWLTDVQARVKAQLSTFNQNRPPGMKATALPVAQQDGIVQQVTGGRYKTLGQLTAATKRQQAGSSAPDDPTGGPSDMRSRANRVRQRLERASPNIVQGSGLPPGE